MTHFSEVDSGRTAREYLKLMRQMYSDDAIRNNAEWFLETLDKNSDTEVSLRQAVNAGWILLVLKYGDKIK